MVAGGMRVSESHSKKPLKPVVVILQGFEGREGIWEMAPGRGLGLGTFLASRS